MEKAALLSFKL